VKAILRTARDNGYELNVINAVEKANEFQKNVIFNKINKHFSNTLKDKTVGIWGLSFKPKTDDIRESSSIILIEKLLEKGAHIQAYDPAAINETRKLFGNRIQYFDDPYEAIRGVDALALMTEWSEFHLPDFGKMSEIMREKVIFDGRNIYDPSEIRKLGFNYYSIGRK
jgi:UDPglucose 6-dehydrogenase